MAIVITGGKEVIGDGFFSVNSSEVRYGRDRGKIGSITVTSGSQKASTDVYQKGCPQHISNTQYAIDPTTVIKSGVSNSANTTTVTLYSNAKYFYIKKVSYAGKAYEMDEVAGSGEIFSWNANGHNYDDSNITKKYSDATINKVLVDGVETVDVTMKNGDVPYFENGSYRAGGKGTDVQYPLAITFNIPQNIDDTSITRKFRVIVYGDSGDTIYTNTSLDIILVQNGGNITITIETPNPEINWNKGEVNVQVKCNSTWSASVD